MRSSPDRPAALAALRAGAARALATLAAVILACVPAPAGAQGEGAIDAASASIADPDLARLASGQSQRSNWQPPGTVDRYGHAEVLVAAPSAQLRKMVLDFGHYRELTGGKFHVSRVIGKEAGGTDVYFQIPILDGMITLWQVFRFQELRPLAPGWTMIEGWYVKGNIGRGNAAWTLHAIDDMHTILKFDLLVVPSVPLPQALIDDGLRNAAGEAVESVRDRAQEHPGAVRYTPPFEQTSSVR